MPIKVGDKLPNTTFRVMTAEGPKPKTTDEVFKGKKVALFAVPGAFTPTCSNLHMPSFLNNIDAFKAKGIDTVAGFCRNGLIAHLSAITFQKNIRSHEIIFCLINISVCFVDFIDCDNKRCFRLFKNLDRFFRLRLHAAAANIGTRSGYPRHLRSASRRP